MSGSIQTNQRVSVIGLGAMGSSIARTLLDGGYRVSVWNRSRGKIDAMASLGALACESPKEALTHSSYTVVCLKDYPVWKRVIEDYGLHDDVNGACVIQLTGGTMDEVREHAAFIEAHGGRVADGALMCFPRQLGTDDASLLVAGASDVLEDCAPLLGVLAPGWTHLGDDVTRPAVLSRALTAGILTSLIGLINGIAICQAGGISLDVFMRQIQQANAFLPDEKNRLIEAVRDGRTADTQASINTWLGAHQTIHSVAGTLGTNLVLQDTVQVVLREAQRQGLGEFDLSSLVKVFTHDALKGGGA